MKRIFCVVLCFCLFVVVCKSDNGTGMVVFTPVTRFDGWDYFLEENEKSIDLCRQNLQSNEVENLNNFYADSVQNDKLVLYNGGDLYIIRRGNVNLEKILTADQFEGRPAFTDEYVFFNKDFMLHKAPISDTLTSTLIQIEDYGDNPKLAEVRTSGKYLFSEIYCNEEDRDSYNIFDDTSKIIVYDTENNSVINVIDNASIVWPETDAKNMENVFFYGISDGESSTIYMLDIFDISNPKTVCSLPYGRSLSLSLSYITNDNKNLIFQKEINSDSDSQIIRHNVESNQDVVLAEGSELSVVACNNTYVYYSKNEDSVKRGLYRLNFDGTGNVKINVPENIEKDNYKLFNNKILTYAFGGANEEAPYPTTYLPLTYSSDIKNILNNSVVLKYGSPDAIVNNELCAIDPYNLFVKPLMDENNRILVPARFLTEKFGGSINWDDTNKTATINIDGRTVIIKIGEKSIVVDGMTHELDTSAVIAESRVMIPLRAFVEKGLEKNVYWDSGLIVASANDLKTSLENPETIKTIKNEFYGFYKPYQYADGY